MVGAIFAFWYLIFRHFKLTVSLLWKRVSICVLVVPRVVRFLELMDTMRPILNICVVVRSPVFVGLVKLNNDAVFW